MDYILVPIGGGPCDGCLHTCETSESEYQGDRRRAGRRKLYAGIPGKGEVTTLPHIDTIADGTAVKTPGSSYLPVYQKNLDDIITVEDEELIVSFLDMVENHKMIVENSGLSTVAALKHLNMKKKIVSILAAAIWT